jgi:hypothetical protein
MRGGLRLAGGDDLQSGGAGAGSGAASGEVDLAIVGVSLGVVRNPADDREVGDFDPPEAFVLVAPDAEPDDQLALLKIAAVATDEIVDSAPASRLNSEAG